MRYVILIYQDEGRVQELTRSERLALEGEYAEVVDTMKASGRYLGSAPLRSTDTATTVRVRGGRRTITDGPVAETMEQLGDVFLIEARDLDAALDAAARVPGARTGSVEVRPLRNVHSLEENEA